MDDKRKTAPATNRDGQGARTNTTTSIPSKAELDKMPPVMALRVAKNLRYTDMALRVNELYPEFDIHLLLQVERGNTTGIDLRQDVMPHLYATFAPEMAPKPKRKDKRKLARRISGRLNEADYTALMALLKRQGYATVQDWLAVTIRRALAASRWRGDANE